MYLMDMVAFRREYHVLFANRNDIECILLVNDLDRSHRILLEIEMDFHRLLYYSTVFEVFCSDPTIAVQNANMVIYNCV